MLLKDIEVIPREIPEHTYWLIRCLEFKYAKAFVERGSMRFANPSEWSKPDGTSRGDLFEGVYASQRDIDPNMDFVLRALRNDVFSFRKDGFTFYKSKEILSYRAHCLYGLNSNNMHVRDVRSQDHQFHQAGKVSKEYFHKLFPKVKEDEIDSLEDDKRPAVLLIRPDYFMSFLTEKLLERGVRKEEILICPVYYFNYYQKPFIIGTEPEELFSKHIEYKEQCEIRIVINTRRKEVQAMFDKNGVIELGPVDDSIAIISEFYFDDMEVEIRGNSLLYTLAKPREYAIDEVDDNSLIIILEQALSDELPNAPMSIEAIEREIDMIFKTLKQRDENVKYDTLTNMLYYKGLACNLGKTAGAKMLQHYNNYILDGDIEAAGDTIVKFKHFFPSYDFGGYFSAYYKALEVYNNG